MAMVSMNVGGDYDVSPCSCDPRPYIYLTEDQVEALGLQANPPAAGSTLGLRAIVRVISKTENADLDQDGDGIDVCLTLQITDMEVTNAAPTPAASMLYGD